MSPPHRRNDFYPANVTVSVEESKIRAEADRKVCTMSLTELIQPTQEAPKPRRLPAHQEVAMSLGSSGPASKPSRSKGSTINRLFGSVTQAIARILTKPTVETAAATAAALEYARITAFATMGCPLCDDMGCAECKPAMAMGTSAISTKRSWWHR